MINPYMDEEAGIIASLGKENVKSRMAKLGMTEVQVYQLRTVARGQKPKNPVEMPKEAPKESTKEDASAKDDLMARKLAHEKKKSASLAKKFAEINAKEREKGKKIRNEEQFDKVMSKTMDDLNKEYNYEGLIPIYKIRRAIGDRVSRQDFNKYMMELQGKDRIQLQGGSVEDSAVDKLEDSMQTKLAGLRTYAKFVKK